MTQLEYPYAGNDPIENRNEYSYVPYAGEAFLEAWRRSRQKAASALPAACARPPAPAGGIKPDGGPVDTAALLDWLMACDDDAGRKALLDPLVRKFEVTKRLYDAYDESGRAAAGASRRSLALYIRFAELLEHDYRAHSDLSRLNALIKCLDTICAYRAELSADEGARLSRLIQCERYHTEAMRGAAGRR